MLKKDAGYIGYSSKPGVIKKCSPLLIKKSSIEKCIYIFAEKHKNCFTYECMQQESGSRIQLVCIIDYMNRKALAMKIVLEKRRISGMAGM